MTREALPEVIDTERLRLRAWALTDVDDVLAYAQDTEWARFLKMIPQPYSRRDAEQFIARQILFDPQLHGAWAITLDGTVVGGINLRLDLPNGVAELGYSIAREHWNRGFTTEAARAVIDAAFGTHSELHRVKAFADVRNTASQRVMEKLGMVKEGVLRQNRIERGEPIDEAWFGVLRSEWDR